MFGNKPLLGILILIGLVQSTEINAQDAANYYLQPISVYSQEVQDTADELMDKGWFTERRFKKVSALMDRWTDQALQCDDFSQESGENFSDRACRNFARSMMRSIGSYTENCRKLINWRDEKFKILETALVETNGQNDKLQLATKAATEQLTFEIDSICAAWNSNRLNPEYEPLVQLATSESRPSTQYIAKFQKASLLRLNQNRGNMGLEDWPVFQTHLQQTRRDFLLTNGGL